MAAAVPSPSVSCSPGPIDFGRPHQNEETLIGVSAFFCNGLTNSFPSVQFNIDEGGGKQLRAFYLTAA